MANQVGVILPAGGASARMGAPVPKQFLELEGRPLFALCLDTFLNFPSVAQVVLVLPGKYIKEVPATLGEHPKLKIVSGGPERWISVKNGFQALDDSITHVLIHDVARPFVSEDIIAECIARTLKGQCTLPGIPSPDTLKEVQGENILRTVDRALTIRVQTPQGFPKPVLEAIYAQLDSKPLPPSFLTDEGGLAEYFGYHLKWFKGSEENRKITTREDLDWARWMAGRRKS